MSVFRWYRRLLGGHWETTTDAAWWWHVERCGGIPKGLALRGMIMCEDYR